MAPATPNDASSSRSGVFASFAKRGTVTPANVPVVIAPVVICSVLIIVCAILFGALLRTRRRARRGDITPYTNGMRSAKSSRHSRRSRATAPADPVISNISDIRFEKDWEIDSLPTSPTRSGATGERSNAPTPLPMILDIRAPPPSARRDEKMRRWQRETADRLERERAARARERASVAATAGSKASDYAPPYTRPPSYATSRANAHAHAQQSPAVAGPPPPLPAMPVSALQAYADEKARLRAQDAGSVFTELSEDTNTIMSPVRSEKEKERERERPRDKAAWS